MGRLFAYPGDGGHLVCLGTRPGWQRSDSRLEPVRGAIEDERHLHPTRARDGPWK